MLTALASVYWRPDFGPSQAAVLMADFVQDLEEFPVPEIEVAIQTYRRDPKSKFFPTPGVLRGIILEGRKERAELDNLGPAIRNFDSRPIMWWMQPRNLWRDHWLEDDIPAEHREGYNRRAAQRRAA